MVDRVVTLLRGHADARRTLAEILGHRHAHEAVMLTFFTTVSVYAICYLLIRIARPGFALPLDSRILFEEDWAPNREGIARAFEQLYKERAAVRAT